MRGNIMRLGVLLALVAGFVLTAPPDDLSAQVTRPPEPPGRAAAARAAGPEMRPPHTPSGVDLNTTQYGLEPGRPRITPYRTDTPPVIDANLDDPVWARAAYLNEFTQEAPNEGAPATERTEVWIAYDDDHIYFAFYAHFSDLGLMRANRVQRDRAMGDDLMTVYFDTFLDQQRGYDFDVNGYGVQGDGLMSVGGRGGGGRGGRWRYRRSTRGPILGCPVRYGGSAGGGRVRGRDADPLQEPTLSGPP